MTVMVVFFLIITLINCQPIDIDTDGISSKRDQRLMLNFTNSTNDANEVIESFAKTSERIFMPQDVELVEPPRKNQQQSVGVSGGIGSLIDIIFAVNLIVFVFK